MFSLLYTLCLTWCFAQMVFNICCEKKGGGKKRNIERKGSDTREDYGSRSRSKIQGQRCRQLVGIFMERLQPALNCLPKLDKSMFSFSF